MRVFVSSTIYDFRDLRSALKHWLEEFGFTVVMSEFNDFPQQPVQNSFDSCLKAIESCDYFIAIIGHRIGGWYDKSQRLTITRMEYRYARTLFESGRLKLIPFVRKDLWTIRDDRNAIESAIISGQVLDHDLAKDDVANIKDIRSKFATHPSMLFDFLREVEQNQAMKRATEDGDGRPAGNWVYQFSDFKDIVDALKMTLDRSGNLRLKVIRANLVHELETNMKAILYRNDEGEIRTRFSFAAEAREKCTGTFNEITKLSYLEVTGLLMFCLNCSALVTGLRTHSLSSAIQSGEFLDFDMFQGRHTVGPLQQALIELMDEIARVTRFLESDN